MSKEKFGIAVAEDITQELDGLVDECDDLQATRSEIVEAILTAYLRSDSNHVKNVRELTLPEEKGAL